MDDDLIDDYNPEECIEKVQYTIEILEDFLKFMRMKAKDR